ncbi:hypothetical protein MES5069_800023 [Mesorhizobium escarrei]|uniref:Uncharacterized protein n=1 Tax=Mesorhizobium escarrei TaxID=666018 RepID=A0ABM9EIZ5_9HYPH|nr:hypothetical protein MES5069_800023 [Mesorhizobium escarrei]
MSLFDKCSQGIAGSVAIPSFRSQLVNGCVFGHLIFLRHSLGAAYDSIRHKPLCLNIINDCCTARKPINPEPWNYALPWCLLVIGLIVQALRNTVCQEICSPPAASKSPSDPRGGTADFRISKNGNAARD